MATSLAVSFPWGRYHATPWGHHVNEGAAEWPPSPWRILRSLYATWQARCAHLDAAVVESMLSALADPPTFVLPYDVGEGHTRHYMPDGSHLGGVRVSNDRALDAFAVVAPDAEVVVRWPADLDEAQRHALAELAAKLPYLGRAESVCSARLLDEGEETPGRACRPLAVPVDDLATPPIRVLVADNPLDIGALTVRTSDVRRERRLDAPGSRWVLYEPVPRGTQGPRAPRRASRAPVRAVRWAVTAPALPSRFATVAMTDVLRRACMSRFKDVHGDPPSPTLTGKTADGVKLEGHEHAHYLATDDDGDGLIDHLILWVPGGLDQAHLAALVLLAELHERDYISDFRPVGLGIEAVGAAEVALPGFCGPSPVWTSVTPFAPTGHVKRRMTWDEHLRTRLEAEARWRGLPPPVKVERTSGPWLRYRSHRPSGERLATDSRRAAGVTVTFSEPILGPLVLGALSHFGLGLFEPAAAG